MKGDQAEYIIPLQKVFLHPKTKRGNKAIAEIRNFARKHSGLDKVLISNELNAVVWKNSSNIPRKVEAVFWKDDDILRVYLKGSKELDKDKKAKVEMEKEKKKKKEEKEKKSKEEEMSDAEKAAKEEADRKKAEKKEKEKAAEKAAIKRKTG